MPHNTHVEDTNDKTIILVSKIAHFLTSILNQVNSGLKDITGQKKKSPFLSVNVSKKVLMGYFQVSPGLRFKTRVGALMQIKLIFTRKVVHLASF